MHGIVKLRIFGSFPSWIFTAHSFIVPTLRVGTQPVTLQRDDMGRWSVQHCITTRSVGTIIIWFDVKPHF